MSSPFVQVTNLSFEFIEGRPLFENLNFSLEHGQCLGITGPSGCGKSTLAQVIAGHLRPKSGHIVIDGKPVTGKPQRDIFLVHQDSDLFPWLTVEKQVAFGMKYPDPAEVRKLIGLTKLGGFEEYFPYQLSGGTKKRLSIARSLAVNPKLLIFDESFSSLDFDLRMEIFTDLKEIWRATRTTIIVISHDPRDLQQIAQSELRLS